MIWILIAVLMALWIGAGVVLVVLGARRSNGKYSREVAGRVFTIGENVDVQVKIIPPPPPEAAKDHDVILAIDHSSSMGSGPGSPLRESLRAAENFVRQLPTGVNVGVVGFAQEARIVSRITASRPETVRALAGLGRGGGTAIHQALDRCSELLKDARPAAGKTVILLSDGGSDHAAALEASQRLQRQTPEAAIVCIGFGPAVDEVTMRAIASSPEKYVHINRTEDLYSLFTFLAAAVGGEITPGIVEEAAHAPTPFRLAAIGGLHPVGVEPEELTRIFWSLSAATENRPALSYTLVAACPGWHSVASSKSRAVWRSADGTEKCDRGPNGPRVLILPWWMRWAWPVFNPLFWMIVRRWRPCCSTEDRSLAEESVKPLPMPSFPVMLPVPDERPYQLRLRPSLVIGLGETGEWTVCRLKERLRDREVDPATVSGLVIRATHRANSRRVRIGSTVITSDECVELNQDLRPYLESLRLNGIPATRAWVPWRQWLADTRPLTTSHTIAGERGRARLALLSKPEPVEQKLQAGIDRIKQSDDGLVIIVGSPHDPECSGLAAEVAHICASRDIGVTLIFVPSLTGQDASTSVLALALELERMVLMTGRRIASDRHDPPVSARQLFDRIVVMEQQLQSVADASVPAAELVWDMLAYDDLFKRMKLVGKAGDEVICTGALVEGQALPAGNLWRWVREQTLARGINGQRLGLVERQGKLVLPSLQKGEVAADVEAFWSARETSRPTNFLLLPSRLLLKSSSPGSVAGLVGLQDVLPAGKPYHEQVVYSKSERKSFACYLEEWCYRILEREQSKGVWGVQALLAALTRIESDFRTILSRVDRSAGTPALAELAGFASSVYADLLNIVTGLRRDVAYWMASLTGPQLELEVPALPDGQTTLCYNIERARLAAERDLGISGEEARQLLEQHLDDWYSGCGNPLLDRLRFRVALEGTDYKLKLKLQLDGDKEIASAAELGGPLREMVDQYRNIILGWPLDRLVQVQSLANPADWIRVGKHSRRIYPRVQDAADEKDPFTVAAVQLRDRSLKEALGVARPLHGEMPYVWPEEANAARIAEKISNSLNRQPHLFSPTVVHLMRDTQKLFRFLSDLGERRIRQEGIRYVLERNGKEYRIGPTSDRLSGLDAFQNVALQVVSFETSLDGELIVVAPAEWAVEPDAAVRAVESHPLANGAVSTPAWEMWRDVIRGVTLEHGNE